MGMGDVTHQPVMPVAMIDWGMSQAERTQFIHFGLHDKTDDEFRRPIQQRARNRECVCTLRQDLMNDEEWSASNMRSILSSVHYGEWLHSVNRPHENLWSMLMLFRRNGASQFSDYDRQTLELMMSTVPWLDADQNTEQPPPGQTPLTARQRTVMLLLLDGLTRKAIASQLAIHEDTVGDHIKAIFKHFGVRSATELAALFLQNK